MNSPQLILKTAPVRVLIACPQRIGDVLLTTPLIRSIKRAWPEARIDVLVFAGTEGVLEGNPDIADVIAVPRKSSFMEKVKLWRRLWRKYDLALACIPTDRARLYAWIAGRKTAGFLASENAKGPALQERVKALLLDQHLLFDDLDTHTVSAGLRLASLLAIPLQFEVVPPSAPAGSRAALDMQLQNLQGRPFAVLHPYPKFRYKMWTPDAWTGLAENLIARGLRIVFTGSPDSAEVAYVNEIARRLPADRVLNLSGTLSLAQTADLLRQASLYAGPDTAVTHIAAATGVPVIALFGPSNPVKWGPWPSTWADSASPWDLRGSARRGNVFLIQGPGHCVPCMLEGCDRHVDSHSDCLDKLAVNVVTGAVDALLSPGGEVSASANPAHHVISLHHARQ